MHNAVMIVSGVFVVLLCIDKPYLIPYAVAGLITGIVLAAIKNKGK